jgi:hypothetical protein
MREEVAVMLHEESKTQTDLAVLQELRAAMALLEHLGDVHELGEQYRYALLKG